MAASDPDKIFNTREQAILYVKEALGICDALSLLDAAVHLQMGLDLLEGWITDTGVDPHDSLL